MRKRYILTRFLIGLLGFAPGIVTATELASVNGAGTDSGNGLSTTPSVSADGRLVAFVSRAGNLGPMDTNGFDDVYVRDLETGITTLVSVNAAGTNGGNQPTDQDPPGISADGRFVVFRSAATNLGPTVTQPGQVYVRDLVAGTTILASVNTAGTDGGNEGAGNPVISANGRYVVFASRSSDLHPTKTDLTPALFVRDLVAETTALVSVNAAGTATGNGNSFDAVISADGRFVAFASNADNLVLTDTNDTADVFVRDLVAETTTLVSVNATGTDSGNGSSGSPVISADGKLVVFASNANDLGPTDTQTGNLYVRDLVAETTALVSVNAAGTDSGVADDRGHVISADGQVVVFRSGTNLASGNITGGSLYARDLGAGTTTLVDVNVQGTSH